MPVWQSAITDFSSNEVWENLYALADSPIMLQELCDLLRWKLDQVDFIDTPVSLPYDCPLDVRCSYTRDQLLVALDFMKPATVREGVKYLPDKQTDVLFVTLNKSDKDYSPTTMYNDYAISPSLFQWQSQSTTSADSTTGQRYIHHAERGSHVLLFVRELMNIVWRLRKEIPAKYLRKTMQVLGYLC